jgi:hypothetical protein
MQPEAEPADDSCDDDGDCVLCTLSLGPSLPCCSGCPAVTSAARCEALSAEMRAACPANQLPLCPAVSCAFPGNPSCQNGMCVSSEGLPSF